MSETIEKHDFIELNYTGRLTDGTVFDTTEKTVAEQNNLPTQGMIFASQIICIGENQVLPGLDKELVGKEVGQEYEITLSAEQAFGKRDIKKMKIVPMSTFIEHKVQPQPGLQIDVDGERGIVARVSGGRIIVNFNHPLAGREVMYSFKIVRKITDACEKVKSYLSNVLRIPREKVEVKVADNQVEITLPVDFPAVLTDLLTKKLLEVTGVKEVLFKKKEVKAEEKPAGK